MNAEEFFRTLRDEILDHSDYYDLATIGARLRGLSRAIEQIEGAATEEKIRDLLHEVDVQELLRLLFGSEPLSASPSWDAAVVASQMAEWRTRIGIQNLRDVVFGLLLANDQQLRARRRRSKFEDLLESALGEALRTSHLQLDFRRRAGIGERDREFDFVVQQEGVPFLAIQAIFQTTGGGRQQEIFSNLPNVQTQLANRGVALLVVADGPGFRRLRTVVREVAPRLRDFTNLHGLARGALHDALESALGAHMEFVRHGSGNVDEKLTRITDVALRAGQNVSPALLGVSDDEARQFLLRYEAHHPEYSLVHTPDIGVHGESAELIASLDRMLNAGRRGGPVDSRVVAEVLGAKLSIDPVLGAEEGKGFRSLMLRLPDVPLRLPNPLPLFLTLLPSDSPREPLFVRLDSELSERARLGVVVDPFGAEESRIVARKYGGLRKSYVAVLDATDLVEILMRKRTAALDYLLKLIIQNVDLTLVSPYVSEGPTPDNMFYGREAEKRRVVEQIGRQSFALIGGRKVGKTSLLRQLRSTLGLTYQVEYVDCQAHPDREDFLEYLESKCSPPISLSEGARVTRAETIVRAFLRSALGEGFGILLLDEVDDLFRADSTSQEHPHVLSRALRSVSQSSTASIVITGERALYELTNDPSSPHWNFCTPIRIGPLGSDAARDLLRIPLAALGITISDAALEMALSRTARHPNLLQFLGTQIVEDLAPSSTSGRMLEVEARHVKVVTDRHGYQSRFITTFWSQASPLEKLLSVHLDRHVAKGADVLYKDLGLDTTEVAPSDVQRALGFLELYAIAQSSERGYIFAADVFEQYLAPLASNLVTEEWRRELQ